ncbi:hypothetical protein TcCL_ESM02741 [Trypanosoma cruzi]|nr:hypothetical protein TcCL_ESM02741 [Trypanosoma cruzi]
MQRRVDAASQYRLLSFEQRRQSTVRGLDKVTPVRSTGYIVRRYETPPVGANGTASLESTKERTDGEDEIQKLLSNAFSLAASHHSHGGKVATAFSAPSSETPPNISAIDNAYLHAMNIAYRLYGQQPNG